MTSVKLNNVQVPIKLLRPEVQKTATVADKNSPGQGPNNSVSVFELERAPGVTEAARQRAIEDVKALANAYQAGALDIVDPTERKLETATTPPAEVAPDGGTPRADRAEPSGSRNEGTTYRASGERERTDYAPGGAHPNGPQFAQSEFALFQDDPEKWRVKYQGHEVVIQPNNGLPSSGGVNFRYWSGSVSLGNGQTLSVGMHFRVNEKFESGGPPANFSATFSTREPGENGSLLLEDNFKATTLSPAKTNA